MITFEELPIVDMDATGKNIRKLRKDKNIRVSQMRDAFGFTSTNAIYKWEGGQCLPSLENLVVLSRIFNCPMEEILVVEERENPSQKLS